MDDYTFNLEQLLDNAGYFDQCGGYKSVAGMSSDDRYFVV